MEKNKSGFPKARGLMHSQYSQIPSVRLSGFHSTGYSLRSCGGPRGVVQTFSLAWLHCAMAATLEGQAGVYPLTVACQAFVHPLSTNGSTILFCLHRASQPVPIGINKNKQRLQANFINQRNTSSQLIKWQVMA